MKLMMPYHIQILKTAFFTVSLLLSVLISCSATLIDEANMTTLDQSQILNVHIVCHTHDDVGWLKTVNQYYFGLNNTIQHASVQSILDTVIRALLENSQRKFTYVEMAYFTMWWKEQSPSMKEKVKELVKNHQLSFANGGWCMHDEATTHFMGMIDQTTRGHDFLKTTFDGYTPRVGWQIDPFGHSATQASLFSAEVGFDALFFGRIDHQDLLIRRMNSQCEGVWRSSPHNFGSDAQVFFGLTGSYRGNYGPPDGFNLDAYLSDEPFVDGVNVYQRLSEFVDQIIPHANATRGNNIMLTMGSDFQYENAFENFKRIDDLIHFVNLYQERGMLGKLGKYSGLRVFYSTPEIYTEAKYSEGIVWNVKEDDFFPYSDCDDCFWTGYFTSRPNLKRLERVASSFLHAARQVDATGSMMLSGNFNYGNESPLDRLDEAISILQHHDGVSGTSKQHVAYDYALRVDRGMKAASQHLGSILNQLLQNTSSLELIYCQDLNVSKCEISQSGTLDLGTDIYVVAYNALATPNREEVLAVPVSRDASYEVYSVYHGQTMQSVLLPSPNYTNTENAAPFVLHFDTGIVPPLGASVFRIRMTNFSRTALQPKQGGDRINSNIYISNGKIRIQFQRGKLQHLCREYDMNCVKFQLIWGYYMSYTKIGQKSGAYIFRPSEADQKLLTFPTNFSTASFYVSDLVSEIHYTISTYVTQIIRLKKNSPYLELQYVVGPIPVDDGVGKELVIRYTSGQLRNNGVFYTDSNGREFIKREVGKRGTWDLVEHQPIAGNYYPVNTATYIHDNLTSLTVLSDRTQGGSSLRNGSIELMVHRRTTHDDARGVGEPIDETDGGISPYPPYGTAKRSGKGIITQGIHKIIVGSSREGAKNARSLMDSTFSPLHLFFASEFIGNSKSKDNVPYKKGSFSLLHANLLPPNVMLITFSKTTPSKEVMNLSSAYKTFLIRIGHQYGKDEGTIHNDPLSASVDVDLKVLFPNQHILLISEKSLSNNQKRDTWEQRRFRWKVSKSRTLHSTQCKTGSGTVITLHPMKICTFEVVVSTLAGEAIREG